ncbi:hypothetical protein EON66_09185 [archaeon]|nr:MAG: hypothetical protein EON66_09185 [archaeon]
MRTSSTHLLGDVGQRENATQPAGGTDGVEEAARARVQRGARRQNAAGRGYRSAGCTPALSDLETCLHAPGGFISLKRQ